MPVRDMQITKYDLKGNIVSQVIERGNHEKSIYSNAQFIGKIPANKLKLIKASENDDIEYWWEMIKITKVIDTENPQTWFTVGMDAMVSEVIFPQAQVDKFLEN